MANCTWIPNGIRSAATRALKKLSPHSRRSDTRPSGVHRMGPRGRERHRRAGRRPNERERMSQTAYNCRTAGCQHAVPRFHTRSQNVYVVEPACGGQLLLILALNFTRALQRRRWAIQPIVSIGCLLAQSGSIFEGELGDPRLIKLAQAFRDHSIVLVLSRARER
jgi:hypothetical protein